MNWFLPKIYGLPASLLIQFNWENERVREKEDKRVKKELFPLWICYCYCCLLMAFLFNNDVHPVYHFSSVSLSLPSAAIAYCEYLSGFHLKFVQKEDSDVAHNGVSLFMACERAFMLFRHHKKCNLSFQLIFKWLSFHIFYP